MGAHIKKLVLGTLIQALMNMGSLNISIRADLIK